MIVSPLTPAEAAAVNIVNQLNNVSANITGILANGIPARPAQGSNPAVAAIAAAEISAALGSTALGQIQAALTALQ